MKVIAETPGDTRNLLRKVQSKNQKDDREFPSCNCTKVKFGGVKIFRG